MNRFKTLSRSQGLNPGSDAWIITSDLQEDSLIRKMDWHLNFQLSRARWHKKTGLPPQLKSILSEQKLDLETEPVESPVVMVMSNANICSQTVIELPKTQSENQLAKQVFQIWEKLNKPSLRVFLSNKLDAAKFEEAWPGSLHENITLVTM